MAPSLVVERYPETATEGYRAYGQAYPFYGCRDPEVVISGPAETGKTRAALEKLYEQAITYPGMQGAIVRKTRTSMTGSVLQTWENKVIQPDWGIRTYGGSHVEWYGFPNGSRIFVGGMDNPDKLLSSERDVIYVNQAEELELDDWEKLCTRATGRAGNMPYAQVYGDCNPSYPQHWIKLRAAAGRLRFYESRHEDNPTLFDPDTGDVTEQGRRSLDVLDNLTGVRYKRLRLGLWAAAEGMVYDNYDPAIHVITRFDIPAEWPRYRSIDFGYTNPFVCQWYAEDPDGRLYLYREIYGTGRIVRDWAEQIHSLSQGEQYRYTVADHDAEDRATLQSMGIRTQPARKDVSPGIQAVQRLLRKAGDGKPRLYFFRDALRERDPELVDKRAPASTIEEFESYIWEEPREGRAVKEAPLKLHDHGMDALRYMVMSKERRGIRAA